MKDEHILKAQKWLDEHQTEMVQTLQDVLRIPSVQGEAEQNAPFGIENRRALDYTLNLANQWGFTVKDVDGYAGHAEIGDGEELIMTLAHLDVVPVGDGWKFEPFGATIKDGYIYARGACDDKGPAYAALWAAIALAKTNAPLKRRIRIVFGCNEESGFGCVKYYFKHEEKPLYGIAPDACWPLVFAEKGIVNMTARGAVDVGNGLQLISLHSGQRPNMVPDCATAVVEGDTAALTEALLILNEYWDKNISVISEGNRLIIKAVGKAAHGSVPFHGDNAAERILRVLLELSFEKKTALEFLFKSSDPAGMALGINGRDEVCGSLTCNLGVLTIENGIAVVQYNIRYPVTWKGETVRQNSESVLAKAEFAIETFTDSPPLYMPVDEEPVKTLVAAYRDETGDMTEPETMGGGTYARAIPNSVAVGAGFAGDGPAHEKDERYAVESYVKSAKIYARMMYDLANL